MGYQVQKIIVLVILSLNNITRMNSSIQQQQCKYFISLGVILHLFMHYVTRFSQLPCEIRLIINQVRQVDTFQVKSDFELEFISVFPNQNNYILSIILCYSITFYSSPNHSISSGSLEVCDLPNDLKEQQTVSAVSNNLKSLGNDQDTTEATLTRVQA